MEIEFVTCAVNRPKLLEITYSTLQKHLKGVNFEKSTLYIHIDKTPIADNVVKVEEVARKYFNNVVVKYTDKDKLPRYSRSFKWAMTQPNGKYFFYIEDDWKFMRDFHIDEFLKYMNNDVKFVSINNNWTHYSPNQPSFAISPNNSSFVPKKIVCTTPSFYNNSFIKQILPEINEIGENAECQMRKIVPKYNVGIEWLSITNHCYCEDLGEQWKRTINIGGSDIHTFCYYNLCENCKKPVPKKIFFCEKCRRRWCSQECKDKQYSEHLKVCEIVPKK